MKRKQSGSKIMMRLIKLVKPLAFFMVLAVILGVTGFLCAIQITVLTMASKRATTILHSSCLPLFVIKYSNHFVG